jgi:hypothetical protein
MFAAADWHGAEWIAADPAQLPFERTPHVLLRKEFQLPESVSTLAGLVVERVTVFCVGLGYNKVWFDGQKMSTHELGAFTTYEKRVLYETSDATAAFDRDQVTKP